MSDSDYSTMGFVTLRDGGSATLIQPERPSVAGDASATPRPSGLIYVDQDPPSLEQLLAQHEVITAVLELPLPTSPPRPWWRELAVGGSNSGVETVADVRPGAVVGLAALAGAISAVGWFLLVASVVAGHLRANPYVALSLALGGLALVITVAVAARSHVPE